MGSPFDDPALLQHHDLVAVPDRAQPVSNDDAGAAAPPQIVVDDLFGDRIERAGRLVENDDGWIGNKRPRDLDSLTLTVLLEVPGEGNQSELLRKVRVQIEGVVSLSLMIAVGSLLLSWGAPAERLFDIDLRFTAPSTRRGCCCRRGAPGAT